MPSENRQFKRFEINEMVKVDIVADSRFPTPSRDQNSNLVFKATNISEEGICLETNSFFIPNQVFKLDFHPRDFKNIQTYAEVVWSERNACGLRFLKREESVRAFIQNKEIA